MTAKNEDLKTPLDCALFYCEELLGSVMPIKNPEHSTGDLVEHEKKTGEVKERKHPDVPSVEPYKKERMTAEEIRQWYAEEPNSNFAIYPGWISNNIIVIDVDGPESTKRFEDRILKNTNIGIGSALVNTMIVSTGGGGKHYYVRLNDPIVHTLGSTKLWSNGKDREEIYICGNGHYVIGFGCRHPNGKLYRWNEKMPQQISKKELAELIQGVAANPDYTLKNYLGVIPASTKAMSEAFDKNQSTMETEENTTTNTAAGTETATIGIGSGDNNNDDAFNTNNTTASEETLNEIYETIKPFYIDGDRDLIHYNLSGTMRKDGDFSLRDCEIVSTKLCESSGYFDEDLRKSLDTIRGTFKKPLEKIKGRSGLYEVLVSSKDTSTMGMDAFGIRTKACNKLLEIISKNKNKNKEERLIDGCIVMEPTHPESKTYMTAFSKDNFWDKVTDSNRPIRAIRTLRREWDEKKNSYVDTFGDIIINAVPVPPITRIYDPLFKLEKYKIIFEYVGSGNTIKQKFVGPLTKEELIDYLKEDTTLVYKEKLAVNALNQVIAGYERKNMLIERKETETEGLIWDHTENKLFLSQRTLYKPTLEECWKCIMVIGDLQSKFYQNTEKRPMERKRFAHFIKIGIAGVASFARRQTGAVGDDNWIPDQDLAGWPRAGKSYGYAGLALRMYRLPLHGSTRYDIPSGNVETESRFIENTKHTTFPVIFEDVDWLSDPEDPKTIKIMPLIKNQVSSTNPRDIQSVDNKRKNLPSCAYIMMTHNKKLVSDDGFVRRSIGHELTVNDEKTPDERLAYEEFFKEHAYTFGYLGDFTLWYYIEHPDIIKYDWITIGKTILKAFYEHAGFEEHEIPKWILDEVVTSASSQEALADHYTSSIINTLHDVTLKQCWSNNTIKREILYYIAKEINKVSDFDLSIFYQKVDEYASQATIKDKLEAISKMDLLPYIKWHKDYEVCIGSGFIDELKKRGYGTVSLTQIPSFCSEMTYNEHVRFGDRNSKKNRMLTIKLADLEQLLTLNSQESRQTTITTSLA